MINVAYENMLGLFCKLVYTIAFSLPNLLICVGQRQDLLAQVAHLKVPCSFGKSREREEPMTSEPSNLMLIQGGLLNAQFASTQRTETDPQDLREFAKWELCVFRLTGNGLEVQVRYRIRALFVFYFSFHGDLSLRVNKDKEREKGMQRKREASRHSGVLLASPIHLEYEYKKHQSCVLGTDGNFFIL